MHRWKAEICAVILPKFELKRSATSGKLRPYVFFFSPKELLRFGWFLRSCNGKHNSNWRTFPAWTIARVRLMQRTRFDALFHHLDDVFLLSSAWLPGLCFLASVEHFFTPTAALFF